MAENEVSTLFNERAKANEIEAEEDEAILSSEEGQYEPVDEDVQVIHEAIVDNGYFDYDITDADRLNFRPAKEIARRFPELTEEQIDKFGDCVEEAFTESLASEVYFKSISDQIVQKGRNVNDDFSKERSVLAKAQELKLEIKLVKLVFADDLETFGTIKSCLIEKAFGRSDVRKDDRIDRVIDKLDGLAGDVSALGRMAASGRRKNKAGEAYV